MSASCLNASFLDALFAYVEHMVFLTTLPNVRGSHGKRHERLVWTDGDDLHYGRGRVIEKYDGDGQGVFFCVSTIDPEKVAARSKREFAAIGKEPASMRSKETVGEIVCVHVDIDLKQVRLGPTDILQRLARLRLPPSAAILSGNGVHAYWFLTEALEATPELVAAHEALLRDVARVVAGDMQVCEIARLMRVPGSHNTKAGAFKPVEVQAAYSDFSRRYEHADLGDFFATHSPVVAEDEIVQLIDRRTGQIRRATATEPDNPFAAHVRAELDAGRFKLPPIDVNRRLSVMTPGNVHATERDVCASLAWRGVPDTWIVQRVIRAVEAMIEAHGLPRDWSPNWNAAEERKIIGLIADAKQKKPADKKGNPHGK